MVIKTQEAILILIVLDDALVQSYIWIEGNKFGVLILVVLDDALVHPVENVCFPDVL